LLIQFTCTRVGGVTELNYKIVGRIVINKTLQLYVPVPVRLPPPHPPLIVPHISPSSYHVRPLDEQRHVNAKVRLRQIATEPFDPSVLNPRSIVPCVCVHQPHVPPFSISKYESTRTIHYTGVRAVQELRSESLNSDPNHPLRNALSIR